MITKIPFSLVAEHSSLFVGPFPIFYSPEKGLQALLSAVPTESAKLCPVRFTISIDERKLHHLFCQAPQSKQQTFLHSFSPKFCGSYLELHGRLLGGGGDNSSKPQEAVA